MVTISEYEKSLTKEYVEYKGFDKLTKQEKESEYISEGITDDVELEINKTYLMYLIYYKDYDKYSIRFYEYGLREVNTNTLNLDTKIPSTDEYKSIKVKNNTNGEYETLDSIIPEKARTNK